VVAGANNRWARRRKVVMADLAEEAWTLPQRDGWIGPAVVEALRASGLNALPHVIFSNSIQLHNALMATGRFFTVLSASTVLFSGKRLALKILPIDLPIAAGAVGIVTLKNRTLSPVTKLFIECAREVASSLANRK
jgi:DNA-binding transcriptional LysR family regulator